MLYRHSKIGYPQMPQDQIDYFDSSKNNGAPHQQNDSYRSSYVEGLTCPHEEKRLMRTPRRDARITPPSNVFQKYKQYFSTPHTPTRNIAIEEKQNKIISETVDDRRALNNHTPSNHTEGIKKNNHSNNGDDSYCPTEKSSHYQNHRRTDSSSTNRHNRDEMLSRRSERQNTPSYDSTTKERHFAEEKYESTEVVEERSSNRTDSISRKANSRKQSSASVCERDEMKNTSAVHSNSEHAWNNDTDIAESTKDRHVEDSDEIPDTRSESSARVAKKRTVNFELLERLSRPTHVTQKHKKVQEQMQQDLKEAELREQERRAAEMENIAKYSWGVPAGSFTLMNLQQQNALFSA